MRHFASPAFWEAYEKLPPLAQGLADRAFERLKANPAHPSLRLKKVGRYWSVRVSRTYRALGVESAPGILWFWIGPHSEYERQIRKD